MTPSDLDRASRRRYARGVRTILSLDDDVLEAASCIADDEGVTVGDVISRLVRCGLEPRTGARPRRRLSTFTSPPGDPPIMSEIIARAFDD